MTCHHPMLCLLSLIANHIYNCVICAVENGCKALINSSAINFIDNSFDPFELCSKLGMLSSIELLVTVGGVPRSDHCGLFYACKYGHAKVMEYWFARGAKIENDYNSYNLQSARILAELGISLTPIILKTDTHYEPYLRHPDFLILYEQGVEFPEQMVAEAIKLGLDNFDSRKNIHLFRDVLSSVGVVHKAYPMLQEWSLLPTSSCRHRNCCDRNVTC